ncbi:MAG: class II aldolase/adducin family protein [Desulfofustis sp.]|nr:class II aldolase/adducin family protein [Desulfofustis sp.]
METKATDYHALLLRQHGLLVAGANMKSSLGIVEEIEQCCQISIVSAMKGGWLTEAQCQRSIRPWAEPGKINCHKHP